MALRLKRLVATLLAALVCAWAPGPGVYEAFASAVRAKPVSVAPRVQVRPSASLARKAPAAAPIPAPIRRIAASPAPQAAAPAPADLAEVRNQIQPDLAAAQELADKPAESAPGLGRRIFNALLGRREPAAADAVAAPETAQAAPRLASPYPGDAAVKRKKVVAAVFVSLQVKFSSPIDFPEVSRPIEVAAVKFRVGADGKIREEGRYEALLDPGQPLDRLVTERSALLPGELKGKPSLGAVLPALGEFLSGADVLITPDAEGHAAALGAEAVRSAAAQPPQMVLDLGRLSRSLGGPAAGLQDLMVSFGVPGIPTHRAGGDASAGLAVFSGQLARLAARARKELPRLTVADLTRRGGAIHARGAAGRMEPAHGKDGRRLPKNVTKEAAGAAARLRAAGQRANLRSVAVRLKVDYFALRDRLREEQAKAAPSPAEAILDWVRRFPLKALIIDYDSTLTDRGPDGKSLPAPQETIDKVTAALKAGIPVAILTGRSLDFASPTEEIIPFTLTGFISRIPAPLRRGLLFSGGFGAELVLFDDAGEPVRVFNRDWTPEEKSIWRTAVKASLAKLKISPSDVTVVGPPGQMNIVFKKADPRATPFALDLIRRFKARGFRYPVNHSHNWVWFTKFDKGYGLTHLLEALVERGIPATDENVLFVGDDFKIPEGHPAGGDAAAALAHPKLKAITVGDGPDVRIPPNVVWLGVKGSRGAWRVIDAVLAGWAPAPAPIPTPPAEKGRSPEMREALRAAFIAAAVLAAPWLLFLGGPGLLSAALLTASGIPQIVDQFRRGPASTEKLALGGFLIWFGAAAGLTVASLLRSAAFGWVASNVAGLLQSLVISLQIGSHRKDRKTWKTIGLYAGGFILASALLLGAGLLLAPAVPAHLAFYAAMALIAAINVPQIRANFWAYDKDRSSTVIPGLARALAMVVAGSAAGAVAAFLIGDWFWFGNSLMGVVMPSIVLGQMFLPALTNRLIAPIVRLFGKPKPAAAPAAAAPVPAAS